MKISPCCGGPIHRTFDVLESGLRKYVICAWCAKPCDPLDVPDGPYPGTHPDKPVAIRRFYAFWGETPGREAAFYESWYPQQWVQHPWDVELAKEKTRAAVTGLLEEGSMERVFGCTGPCLRITPAGITKYALPTCAVRNS